MWSFSITARFDRFFVVCDLSKRRDDWRAASGHIDSGCTCCKERFAIQTARVFTNGNSQAVRLPKEFRFDDEVIIKKVGSAVILLPKHYVYADLKPLFEEVGPLTVERNQPEEEQNQEF